MSQASLGFNKNSIINGAVPGLLVYANGEKVFRAAVYKAANSDTIV